MTSRPVIAQRSFHFRPAGEADLDGVFAILDKEKWGLLSRSQLDMVVREKLTTFYVLTDQQDDDKVKCIGSVSKTRDGESIVGNIIAHQDHRYQDIGARFVRKIDSFHYDVILNGFSYADGFYSILGYHNCEEYALSIDAMKVDKEKVDQYCQADVLPRDVQITWLPEERMEELVQYDAVARGYQAAKLVSFVVRTSDRVAVAVAGDDDQRIVGYLAVRADGHELFFNGFYADGDSIAAALLKQILDAFPKQSDARFFTLYNRQFLLQFGEPRTTRKITRFASRPKPVLIPEQKVYSISQIDIS